MKLILVLALILTVFGILTAAKPLEAPGKLSQNKKKQITRPEV